MTVFLLIALACSDSGPTDPPPLGPSGPSRDLVGSIMITNLSVASGRTYKVGATGLAQGAPRFTDRSYTFAVPPATLNGLPYIRTANADKRESPGSAAFFTFDIDRPALVYVVHDDRGNRPTWLTSGFSDTGLDLYDTDANSGALSVFVASFPAGTVVLGSNLPADQGGTSMYTVLVEATDSTYEPPPDDVPPTVAITAPADSATVRGSVSVSASATDASGVVRVEFDLDGQPIGPAVTTAPYQTTLASDTVPDGWHDVTATATDAAGNQGSASIRIQVDNSAGTTLSVTDISVSSGRSYTLAEEGLAPGVRRYVDRNYIFTDPVPAVLAGLVFVRTANGDKNAAPGSSDFLRFVISAGATIYVVHDDRVPRPAWLSTGFTDTGLDLYDTDGGSGPFSVFAADYDAGTVVLGSNIASKSGGGSMYSVLLRPRAGGEDTEAPTIPGDLSAVPVSSSRIDLTWSASSDNVGVAGYDVYRDGVKVGGATGTSFADTGLEAATLYTYRVAAYDAAGNASGLSASAAAETGPGGDTEPPSAPGGLAAAAVSSAQVDLTWSPSSDNVGVAGYRVSRDGVEVADVAGTAYSDTGLDPATTYWYRVTAYDATGNLSTPSDSASATTFADGGIPASPYPASPVIAGASFDWSTRRRSAKGSDNFPLTWADDGHQYTSWGDGFGFDHTADKKRLGYSRIEGPASAYSGFDVFYGDSGDFRGKSYGLASVDGTLWSWISPLSNQYNWDQARLYRSDDHGASWTGTAVEFVRAQGVGIPGILQFGQDYGGARDGFVYSYFINIQDGSSLDIQSPGEIVLVRAPRDRLDDPSAYEWFAGTSGGQPTWTADPFGRAPVFQDPNGVGFSVSVIYDADLGRYLLATEHSVSREGNLGIFDAPEPWGPWTTVLYTTNWPSGGEVAQTAFYWNFSPKWWSDAGRRFVLVFSGKLENDAFNTVEGTFVLH